MSFYLPSEKENGSYLISFCEPSPLLDLKIKQKTLVWVKYGLKNKQNSRTVFILLFGNYLKSSGGGCPDCLSAPVYESENVEHQGQGITSKGNQVFFLCGRYILYSYNNDPIKTMKT